MVKRLSSKINAKVLSDRGRPPRVPSLKIALFFIIVLFLALGMSGCSTAPGVSLTIDPQAAEPQQVT